jgi:uncharacterized membrane protein
MKYLIIFLFIATLGSIATGFIIESEYSQKFIGFGVLGLFLVAFPIFIYYRWKDKDVKDYMLTKENLDKMRERQNKEK